MTVATYIPELRLVTAEGESILDLDPIQGMWTEAQYLRLTERIRCLVEFTDGLLEVLPMPTDKHQAVSAFLFRLLDALMERIGGVVRYSALPMQIRPGKYREPDLLLLRDANDPRRQNAYWRGADLVVEIVSPDDPARDTVVKRSDYAEAGIPEYWIVDPAAETVTVLRLAAAAYVEHGVFRRGDTATSALLADLAFSVDALFEAR